MVQARSLAFDLLPVRVWNDGSTAAIMGALTALILLVSWWCTLQWLRKDKLGHLLRRPPWALGLGDLALRGMVTGKDADYVCEFFWGYNSEGRRIVINLSILLNTCVHRWLDLTACPFLVRIAFPLEERKKIKRRRGLVEFCLVVRVFFFQRDFAFFFALNRS